MEEAYNEMTPDDLEAFDIWNETHLNFLIDTAKDRDYVFETKPKKEELALFKTSNEDIDKALEKKQELFYWVYKGHRYNQNMEKIDP